MWLNEWVGLLGALWDLNMWRCVFFKSWLWQWLFWSNFCVDLSTLENKGGALLGNTGKRWPCGAVSCPWRLESTPFQFIVILSFYTAQSKFVTVVWDKGVGLRQYCPGQDRCEHTDRTEVAEDEISEHCITILVINQLNAQNLVL